ncbi:hypothetical protein EXIGLDRAFT_696573 [Exidia glandulosa HHB12029]|uniref:DUF6533 domain-containing protein n=1 Tax=Exidia glandulosa HHB12029 TaxID=1314781 RepID=A0A165F8S3_EXIGL|nr:hypothetical protein EXIGLDRAFT_696573 [Exidia glandulosa HHB12029]
MVVHHLDSIAYVKVVAFVWYHWDAILTLGDEVDFIWRRGWTSRSTWSIGLFLLRRRSARGIFNFSSPLKEEEQALTLRLGRCHLLASLNSSGSFVLAFLVSIILQSRIYVMYQRSRLILISNGILCLLAALISALIITLFFPARHEGT